MDGDRPVVPPVPNLTLTQPIPLPANFNFGEPSLWPQWKRRFLRYRQVSGLEIQPIQKQCATLIYCMGDTADEIHETFNVDATVTFDQLIAKFDQHFNLKDNIIYERAQFFKRNQLKGEPVSDFINALHSLGRKCNFNNVTLEDMIRDRIVIGICDEKLSSSLMLDPDLTLQTATTKVRQKEAVDLQQKNLRMSSGSGEVDRVFSQKSERNFERKKICFGCGKDYDHQRSDCPAFNATCSKCKRKGHFAVVCGKYKRFPQIREVVTETKDDKDFFLGTIICHVDSTDPERKFCTKIRTGGIEIFMKIDTGADRTAIPEDHFMRMTSAKLMPADCTLFGPEGKKIEIIGMLKQEMTYNNKTSVESIYVAKHLKTPLLGIPAIIALGIIPILSNLNLPLKPFIPQDEYPNVFKGLGCVNYKYTIKIKPDAVSRAVSVPRRIPIPLMDLSKQELDRMVEREVVQVYTEPSEWCSPVVVCPQKDKLRFCIDFTYLNQFILRENFPIPSIEESLARLGTYKIFSKIDANRGFWQISISPECQHLTCFITPWGRYICLRLPFGISSAPEIFQRFMMNLLEGIPGVTAHMDDVIIGGKTQTEHDERLRLVLTRVQEAGMTLNETKCVFSVTRIEFLGHIIDAETGVTPNDTRIKSVLEMKPPKNKEEVKSLWGTATYLGRFVPNLYERLQPIVSLLKSKNQFIWDQPQEAAFQDWKKILTSKPVLVLFDPSKPIHVSADASQYGLGAVLRIEVSPGDLRVVSYASRGLLESEKRYAQIEKEALALVFACERFSDYITGLEFTLETDHKPLLPILTSKNLDDISPKLLRYRLRLMRFSFKLIHTPGKDIPAADALSRNPDLSEPAGDIDVEINAYIKCVIENLPASSSKVEEILEAQKGDEQCSLLYQMAINGWPEHKKKVPPLLHPYWSIRNEITVEDGILMRGHRLIIPSSLQKGILTTIHEGHMGITRCRSRAATSVFWPGINFEIKEMVEQCATCLQERQNRPEPLLQTDFPSRPWQRVGMDLFYHNHYNYLLVTDYYSRYPEIAKLENLSSKCVVNHCKSIFARHGIPEVVVTDNGPQFSLLHSDFSTFANEYGFKHVTSSPRYPQSNGLAEASVKIVKSLLTKSTDPYKALLIYRSTPLSNGYSPAELSMNRKLRSGLPIMYSQLHSSVPDNEKVMEFENKRKEANEKCYNKIHRTKELPGLCEGQKVWITDLRRYGTVERKDESPRSWWIRTDTSLVRRNRKFLAIARNIIEEDLDSKSDCDPSLHKGNSLLEGKEEQYPGYAVDYPSGLPIEHPPTRNPVETVEAPEVMPHRPQSPKYQRAPVEINVSSPRSRYGRRLRPPERLNFT